MSGFQEKKLQGKKHIKEVEQASKQDMTGVLELLDWQFKSNMMKMLRIIMNKVEHGQCKQRNGNPKKELKSSARDKNNRQSEDCL